MRPVLLALSLLMLAAAGTAGATQVSYIDQGQVWVATVDGAQKRAISGPAPLVEAGESRTWTDQAQSDDGWIVGVAFGRVHAAPAAAGQRLCHAPGADPVARGNPDHRLYVRHSLTPPFVGVRRILGYLYGLGTVLWVTVVGP